MFIEDIYEPEDDQGVDNIDEMLAESRTFGRGGKKHCLYFENIFCFNTHIRFQKPASKTVSQFCCHKE